MSDAPMQDNLLAIGTLKAVVHPESEGGYWAEVPELPGCYTRAETLDELVINLQEAVEGWLEADAARRHTTLPNLAVLPRVRLLELAA